MFLGSPESGDEQCEFGPNRFAVSAWYERSSGCSAAWLARYLGVVEVVGSNPASPTCQNPVKPSVLQGFFVLWLLLCRLASGCRELRQTEASDPCAAFPRPNEYRRPDAIRLMLRLTLRWRHVPDPNLWEHWCGSNCTLGPCRNSRYSLTK